MGNMVSIYHLMDEDPDWLQVKFKKYRNEFILNEYYCIDPKCTCQEIKINVCPLEGNRITEAIISFSFDLKTFKAYDINLIDPYYDIAYMLPNIQGILVEQHAKLCEHAQLARAYGMSYANQHVDQEFILEAYHKGYALDYAEVYGNGGFVRIDGEKEEYTIVDSYFIDPCYELQEVILTYVKVNTQSFKNEVDFMIRLNLNTFDANIEKSQIEEERIIELIQRLACDDQLVKLLKEREHEMRLFGLRIKNELYKEQQSTSKVSRNAPCPCGSGKKFKFCCGKQI